MATEIRFAKPTVTTNAIADIHQWIQAGDVVTLESEKTREVFHNCKRKEDKKGTEKSVEEEPSVAAQRFIYVEVGEDLMARGEWPDHLRGSGSQNCTCSLTGKAISRINLPYKYEFSMLDRS